MKRLLISLVAVVALAGCATSYQAMDDHGGYLQRQTGSNQYLVSFHGNQYTGYDRARDFALLRAAEIGEKLGYSYFSVDGRGDSTTVQEQAGVGTSYTSTTVDSSDPKRKEITTVSTGTPAAYPTQNPGVDLWVTYFAQKPEGRFLELYAVSQTASTLRAKYDVGT